MTLFINSSDIDFEKNFQALLETKRDTAIDVTETVKEIIGEVKSNGDQALEKYSLEFDKLDLRETGIAIKEQEFTAAFEKVGTATIEALTLARDRICSHHLKQKPENQRYTDHLGIELGYRWTPVSAAGLYVPGGTAAYPSSVLMNAIPATVAGVGRIVMVVPTPHGTINPAVLVAAKLLDINEIYRVGGAHAIAALAYGTKTIKAVDKIVGPGNAYVAEAKRQVFGTVGIDMIAGPSEVLIIADRNNDPEWIAADLLAQAEHDPVAQSILITDDKDFADRVKDAVTSQLVSLPRADIAEKSWENFGAIICVENIHEAAPLANQIAAEHLEIAVEHSELMFDQIHHAGAVFIGNKTPEAIGDYIGGSNHVLPTSRSARFASGLSVLDFMKKTTILKCTDEGLATLGPAAITLAKAEQLEGHARSVGLRLGLKI